MLKNISKRRVHVIRTNYLNAYKIEVKDDRGSRVMPTELGKELLVQSMFLSGRIPIYLDPGQLSYGGGDIAAPSPLSPLVVASSSASSLPSSPFGPRQCLLFE